MNRRFYISLLATIILSVTGLAGGQDPVIFTGTVSGNSSGYVIRVYNKSIGLSDTIAIEDGKFNSSFPFVGATRYMFFTSYDLKVKRGYTPFGVLVDEPCTVNIDLEIEKGFPGSHVTGSEPNDKYNELIERIGLVDNKDAEKSVVKEFIVANPDSYVSVFILNRMSSLFSTEEKEELFRSLSKENKNTIEGKKIEGIIAGEKSSAVGEQVRNFTLETADGEYFSLKSLKGKYVLIDFWASWCGPCHEKFPELKVLYNELKDKGFEIVSVSTDRKKEAWLADLKRLDLPWIQVIDEQGDKSVATNSFAVIAIPTLFLIGPDGTIILKNPTDQQIKDIVKNN